MDTTTGAPTGAGAGGSGGSGPGPAEPGPTGPETGPGTGAPPSGTPGTSGPGRGADSFFESIERLGIRRSDDRWVAGVAGGLARRLNLDPLLVRGVWFVLCLIGGAGFMLYGIAWALLPDERDGRSLVQDAVHGSFRAGLVGAIVAFILGVNWRTGWWGWWDGDGWVAGTFWVFLLAGIAVVVASLAASRSRGGTGTAPTTPPPPYQGPGASAGGGSAPAAGYPAASYPAASYPAASYLDAPAVAPIKPAPYAASYPAADAPPSSVPFTVPAPVPQPPAPVATEPRPDRGRARTGAIASAVVGLCLVAGAIVFGLDRDGHVSSPWLVWGGISLVLLGLGIVVGGLRGRAAGGLTTLAILVGLVAVPGAALVHDGAFDGDVRAIAPESPVVATDVAEAEDGYTYSVGDLTVDLTRLPLPAAGDDPVTVPVRLGAGESVIQVPRGAEVRAVVHMFAGDVDWLVGPTADHQSRHGGHANSDTFETAGVAAGGEPQLVLDVSAGAGTVTIEEQ